MISVHHFVFNPFQENTYLLSDETGECLIVDAGCMDPGEEEELDRYIRDHGLHPAGLVNTHCHLDHLTGNRFCLEKYSLLTQCHKDDVFLLEGASGHAMIFGMVVSRPPAPGNLLSDGSTVKFGDSVLEVIHVPGHSPGSIALFSAEEKFVLVGDVLFQGSIGRTDLPGGNFNTLLDSIKSRLFPLGDEVRVLPGHGPTTTIGEEKKHNPFLA